MRLTKIERFSTLKTTTTSSPLHPHEDGGGDVVVIFIGFSRFDLDIVFVILNIPTFVFFFLDNGLDLGLGRFIRS